MYDTPIPLINYVMIGITASVLAYVTALDTNDTSETISNATSSLPVFNDKSITTEPELPKQELPEAEESIANTIEPEQSVTTTVPVGGKSKNKHKHKHKKTKRHIQSNKNKKTRTNKPEKKTI
jgi:hypothetical protein